MRKSFGTLYNVTTDTGVVLVRTPTFGEMTQFLVISLAASLAEMIGGNPDGVVGENKFLASRLLAAADSPSAEGCEMLSDIFFFSPCPACEDSACREWPFVFSAFDGTRYALITDCSLEPLPEKDSDLKEDPFDFPPEGETLDAFLERNIKAIIDDPAVVEACIDDERHIPGTESYAASRRGAAEAFQDILSLIKRVNPPEKVNTNDV